MIKFLQTNKQTNKQTLLIKKIFVIGSVLLLGFIKAQTGKVGINTENPKETLEVKGTLRVDNLPESGNGKIYDGSDIAATTFTGVNTLVADEQGNIGVIPRVVSFPKALLGADGIDAFTSTATYDYPATTSPSNGNRRYDERIKVVKFVLEKKSLLDISTSMSVSILNYDITENTKRLGLIVNLNGKSVINAGVNVVMQSGKNSDRYVNIYGITDAGLFNGGVYTVPGRTYLVLEPGEYTLEVIANISMASYDFSRVRLRYGTSSTDRLDVIAYPLE